MHSKDNPESNLLRIFSKSKDNADSAKGDATTKFFDSKFDLTWVERTKDNKNFDLYRVKDKVEEERATHSFEKQDDSAKTVFENDPEAKGFNFEKDTSFDKNSYQDFKDTERDIDNTEQLEQDGETDSVETKELDDYEVQENIENNEQDLS